MKKKGKTWKLISVVMVLALIVGLLPTGFLGLTEKVEAAIRDDSGSITVFTENFENSDTTYYEGTATSYSKLSDSDITPMNTYKDEKGNTVSGSGGSWALRTSSSTYVTAALTDEWDGDGDDGGKSLKLTSTRTSSDTSYYTYLTRISSDFLTDAAKERLKNGTSSALDTITLSYDFKTVSTATASTAAYHTVYSGLFGYGTTMWSSTTAVATTTGYSLYGGVASAYGRAIYLVPTAWYKASTDSTLTDAIDTTAAGKQYVQRSFGLDQYSTYAYYDSVTYDSSTGEITAEGTYKTTGTLKYIDGYYYVGVNLYYATKYATTYIDNITVTYEYQNVDNMYSDLEESGQWENIITPYTEDAIQSAFGEGTISSPVYSSDVDEVLLSAGCTDYGTGSFENGDWTMILSDSYSGGGDTSASYTFGTWYKNSSGSTMAHWGNSPSAGSSVYYLTTVDSMFAGDYETNVKAYSYSASVAYGTMWVVAKLDIDEETGLGDGQYELTPEGYSILGKVENSGSYASSALTQQYGTYSGYKNGNLMFSLSKDYSNVQFGYYVVSNSTSSWGSIDDCYLIGYREDDVNKLVSVEELDDISVGMGFSDDEVLEALPDEVELTMAFADDLDYEDTWTEERELTWDISAVKTSAIGSYTATYTYESDNGAVQSGSITVTVEYYDVASTSEINGFTVYVGATGKEIWAALPTFTIDVTSSYGNMTKEETLSLTWSISAVDTSTPGDYTATYTYTSAYAGTQTGSITISVTDISSDRVYISGVKTGETGTVEVAMSSDADYPDGTFELIDLATKSSISTAPKTNGFARTTTNCTTSSEYAHGGSKSARLRIEDFELYDYGYNDGYNLGYTASETTQYAYFHQIYNNDVYGYIRLNAEDDDNVTWTQETFKFTATAETMIVAFGCFSSLANAAQSNLWCYLYDLTVGTEYTVSYWHTGYITKSSGSHYFYIDDVTITYEGELTTTLYYDYAGTYAADTVTVEAAEISDISTEVPEYVTADLVIEDNNYIKEGDDDYTTTQKLAVTWDEDSLASVNEAIENNEPGVFTITGTVVYDGEEIVVETTVTVCVDYYTLVSESKVYGVTVATGTSIEDVEAALTADIDVVSTSGGDTPSETLELTWDLSEVDPDTAGEYTAKYTYKSMYLGTQTGTVTVKVADISSDKAYIEGVGTGVIDTAYVEWSDGYTNGTFENVNLVTSTTAITAKTNCLYTNNTTYTQRSKNYANNGSYSAKVTVKSGTSTLYYIAYPSVSVPSLTNSAWNTVTLTDGDTEFTHVTFTFTNIFDSYGRTPVVFTAGSGYLYCLLYNLEEDTEYTVSFYYTGAISGYVYIDDVEITYPKEETTVIYYDYAGTYTIDNETTVDEGEKVDISTIVPIYATADLVLEDNDYISADTEDYDYTTTQNLPVTWDEDSLAAVNKNVPGEYTITGTAAYAGEEIAVTALVTVAEAHQYEAVVTDPTCTEGGYTTYTCVYCGDSYVDDYTDALGHKYADVVTPATLYSDGVIASTCSACGDVESTTTIPKVASVSLSGTSFTYTGSAVEPAVTVTDIDGNVVSSEYYTVTYSGNTAAGTATATVTFTGNYSGTVTESFTITASDSSNTDDTDDGDSDTDNGGTTVVVTSDNSGSGSASGSSSSSTSPKTGDVTPIFALELILLLALAVMIMSVKKTRKALKELL